MSRLPIRIRLTLIFAAAMAVVLAATGLFVYRGLASALDDSIDRNLQARAEAAAGDVGQGGDREDGFTQVLGRDGTIVRGTLRRSVLTADELRQAATAEVRFERKLAGFEEPVRILARPFPGRRILVAGESAEPRADALEDLLTLLLVGGPVALLLAALAAYAVAGAALRPVEAMRAEADAVSAAEPGRRLPLPRADDEIARLGRTLNRMLARLEDALERERRFVADASHELRTPLASLRAELELALRHERSREELRAALASAADETQRLSQLAADLLVLARAEGGRLPVRREELEVEPLLEHVRDRYSRSTGLEIDVEPGLTVSADRLRTEQAIGNLVENALRHGALPVVLSGSRRNAVVRLAVRDSGRGFDEGALGSAFEPFTRGDPARTGPGTGLGLAIVDVIARAHGGTAHVANANGGAEAWIELPG